MMNVLTDHVLKGKKDFFALIVEDPDRLVDDEPDDVELVFFRQEEDFSKTRLKLEEVKAYSLQNPIIFVFQAKDATQIFPDAYAWFPFRKISSTAILEDLLGIAIPRNLQEVARFIIKTFTSTEIFDRKRQWSDKRLIDRELEDPRHFLFSMALGREITGSISRREKLQLLFRCMDGMISTGLFENFQPCASDIALYFSEILDKSDELRRVLVQTFQDNKLVKPFFVLCFVSLILRRFKSLNQLTVNGLLSDTELNALIKEKMDLGITSLATMADLAEVIESDIEKRPFIKSILNNLESTIVLKNQRVYFDLLDESTKIRQRENFSFLKKMELCNNLVKLDGRLLNYNLQRALRIALVTIASETNYKLIKKNIEILLTLVENCQSHMFSDENEEEINLLRLLTEFFELSWTLGHLDFSNLDYKDWLEAYKINIIIFSNIYEQVHGLNNKLGRILKTEKSLDPLFKEISERINSSFISFIVEKYVKWVEGERPPMVIDVVPKFLRPIVKSKEFNKVFFVIIDGMPLDSWLVFRDHLQKYFSILEEELFFSILPSKTYYSRRALFAGHFPFNIWSKDEGVLITESLNLKAYPIDRNFITYAADEKKRNTVYDLVNSPSFFKVLIFNFHDIVTHRLPTVFSRKEVTETFFVINVEPIFREIARQQDCCVVISSDHGFTRITRLNAIAGIEWGKKWNEGDETGSRYVRLLHHPLKLSPPDWVIQIFNPIEWGLGGRYPYLLATHEEGFGQKTERVLKTGHGGVSLEEMIVPCVVMKPRLQEVPVHRPELRVESSELVKDKEGTIRLVFENSNDFDLKNAELIVSTKNLSHRRRVGLLKRISSLITEISYTPTEAGPEELVTEFKCECFGKPKTFQYSDKITVVEPVEKRTEVHRYVDVKLDELLKKD